MRGRTRASTSTPCAGRCWEKGIGFTVTKRQRVSIENGESMGEKGALPATLRREAARKVERSPTIPRHESAPCPPPLLVHPALNVARKEQKINKKEGDKSGPHGGLGTGSGSGSKWARCRQRANKQTYRIWIWHRFKFSASFLICAEVPVERTTTVPGLLNL